MTYEEELLAQDLDAFLIKWEESRVQLIAKYMEQVDRHKDKPHMIVCYEAAGNRVDYYQHELDMLRELRRRAGL